MKYLVKKLRCLMGSSSASMHSSQSLPHEHSECFGYKAILGQNYAWAKMVKNPHLNPLPEGEEVMECPRKCAWPNLNRLDGDAKENRSSELQYRHTLENLGKQGGMLETIFRKVCFSRSVPVHLFGEFWRIRCTYEYGYSLEGVNA